MEIYLSIGFLSFFLGVFITYLFTSKIIRDVVESSNGNVIYYLASRSAGYYVANFPGYPTLVQALRAKLANPDWDAVDTVLEVQSITPLDGGLVFSQLDLESVTKQLQEDLNVDAKPK